MDRARLVERMAPVVVLGLLVPGAWALVTVALPDGALATLDGALVVEGRVGDVVRIFHATPVFNVTVVAVVDRGASLDASEGDTLEVLAEPFRLAGRHVAAAQGDVLRVALVATERHDPATGETTWVGFLAVDARPGWLWASQREVLPDVLRSLLPSLFGAVLLGYGLGLPHPPNVRRLGDVVPAVVSGVALGLLLGALVASFEGENIVFPDDADGVPLPGVFGYLVGLVGVAAVVFREPDLGRDGDRTAILAGIGIWSSLPFALAFAAGDVGSAAFQPGGNLSVLSLFATISVVVAAAARWLTLRWARLVAAVVLVAPPLLILASVQLWSALALPLLVLGVAGARELVRREDVPAT